MTKVIKDKSTGKSLKKRLTLQFSAFVAAVVIFLTFVVTILFILVLTGNLKTSLSANVYHVFHDIEQRISFLAENTKNFSKNHFIINSLIDVEGRFLYLPDFVKNFNTAQDIYAVTIVDFEGNIIHSTLKNQPDYQKTIYLRDVLDAGKSIVQMSDNQKNIIFVEPIKYYQTPQGAVIVELNLNNIISQIIQEDKDSYFRLYSRRNLYFSQNYIEGESYITIKQGAGKTLSYMDKLGIEIESGVLRNKHYAPILTALIPLILIGISFITVSIILAARIGGNISGPILQLCDRVRKAKEFGEQKCSPTGTGDELEELAQVFDDRTEELITSRWQLEEQTEVLKYSNRHLQKEITHRKKTEEKLHRNNQELEQFLQIASHDLQEPLRKITTFGSGLLSKYGENLDARGHHYLKRMQKASERMQTLIQGLLLYSRLTSREQPFVPVDLSELAKKVLSGLKMEIEQTDGRVNVDNLPVIDCDPLQIQLLFENLIVNSLKYCRKDKPPVVKIYGRCINGNGESLDSDHSNDKFYQLTVEDNGIGFDEKYTNRIFNVFQRLHGGNKYEGAGIGLSICRKIAERHGGSITAKSSPGEGSSFIITLPVKHSTEVTDESSRILDRKE